MPNCCRKSGRTLATSWTTVGGIFVASLLTGYVVNGKRTQAIFKIACVTRASKLEVWLSCTRGKRHKRADSENNTHPDGQTNAEHMEGTSASAAKKTNLATTSKADSKADSKDKRRGKSSTRSTHQQKSSTCNDSSSDDNE